MNIKEERGVTVFILVITVVIMLILGGTVAISISGYGEVRKLTVFANDLQNLQEKVNIYYENNNELPVGNIITTNVEFLLGDNRNENDGEDYYKINLELLENISLTYGLGSFQNDYFIVNEQSHNVYYYAGLEANNTTYYGIKTIPQNLTQVQFGVQTFNLSTTTNASVTDGVLDIQLEVYTDVENENVSGYKYKLDNEEWTSVQTGNSYTFHNLKQYGTYTVSMIIIDNNNNEIYATNNETKVTIKALPVSLTIDGKTTGTYNNPLIPAGFVAINENNAVWQSSDGYKNGLVITDAVNENGESTGNEFVWVPVDGTLVTFERRDFEKRDGTYADYTEDVPQSIATSVTSNGGFYIARYEAGKETINSIDTLVFKKGANVWNNINWSTSKTKAESIYPSSNTNYGVISTLIYGTQWDTALSFIGAYNVGETGYNTYATDSTGMGNYAGTSGGDTTTDTPATSGILNTFRQKNIYDMAGNVNEWTMETYITSKQAYRGGGFYGNPLIAPAGLRAGIYNTTDVADNLGFRVALYLK